MEDEDFTEKDDSRYRWLIPGRERGVLTQRERRYLLGEIELEGQNERNIRYQIRRRMIESLNDLILISDPENGLQDRDIKRVLKSVDSLVLAGALSYIAYRGLDERLVEHDKGMTGNRVSDFKYLLVEMIESAERSIDDSKGVASVSVDIEVDRGIIDEQEVLEKMKSHEATEREFNMWTHLHGYDEIRRMDGTVGFKTIEGNTVVLNEDKNEST